MADDVDPDVLQEHAERLYAGAPEDFTEARNEVVKKLRGDGDRPTAAAVAGLRRPTQAAWVVNQLVRHRSEVVEELLELGAALRSAQASLDADTLRQLTRQRRRLVAGVAREAGALAREAGTPLTSATERQVEDTLQAAVVDADLADVVRSGLLVQPLSSTGVDSLAEVQAIPGAPRLTVVPDKVRRGSSAEEAPSAPSTKRVGKQAMEADHAEREEREREQERARERTRLQRDRRAERRDLEKADSAVARLERDVEDLRQRLEAAETTLREAQQRRDAVQSRIDTLDEALERLSGSGSEG
jgi:hypothetical protein